MREVLTEEYLISNRTKRATRGWKATCPSCGGNDLWYTVDTGSAFCFECGTSYSVGDVPRQSASVNYQPRDVQSVRSVYAAAMALYRDCLQPEHRDYLRNRGLDDTAIDDFSLGFCPPRELPLYQLDSAKLAGLCTRRNEPFLADRVVFPYLAASETTDVRGRAIEAIEPRYKSPQHDAYIRGAVFPFNHDRALAKAEQTRRIIVTEGEFKAILADMHGFSCVALPGMLSWRSGLIEVAKYTPIIMFDNSVDPYDRMRVDRAIARLVEHLPMAKVAVLPLLGEDKQDIDSFLLHPKGGIQRFEHIINGAVPYTMYKALRRF